MTTHTHAEQLWQEYIETTGESRTGFVRIIDAALREQIEACAKVVDEKNKVSCNLFINCDEISAYRLACEHIAAAIRAMKEG